jgi:hypothetical protein
MLSFYGYETEGIFQNDAEIKIQHNLKQSRGIFALKIRTKMGK